jgi:dCTP deaminase
MFKEYFLDHLFQKNSDTGVVEIGNPELNSKFRKTIRYVEQISTNVVSDLVKNLKHGLPIPSHRIDSSLGYQEKSTSVQQILLAAWIHRNTNLKDELIQHLANCDSSLEKNTSSSLLKETCVKFDRFDQALLRSIQISEYFDMLEDKREEFFSQPEDNFNDDDTSKSLLVDKEITKHLINDVIKVIPIISLKNQLGSTSLDIRLGTTFERYLPNQSGILDFAKDESIKNINRSAQRINLDFLDSTTINPGQFILGHSMEYIKLPDYISADLEGRSSFARLGIEIHMTAGFIDPGFEGVLTFEIFNAGPSPVRLYPGLRVGQLRFTRTSHPNYSYQKKRTAKYAGLLEYHKSKQSNDYEVQKIRDEIYKKDKRRN